MDKLPKSIWLSGSRGFIGPYIVRTLQTFGNYVKCISNSNNENSNILHIDFSDKESIIKTTDKYGVPDVFIHLGWGNVYKPQAIDHITTNLQDGKNLIDVLYEKGLEKFILIGSASEYGDREGLLSEDLTPSGNLNNYIKGNCDLKEYGLDSAVKHNRVFIHIRLFYTFGAGQKHNSLINQLYKSHDEGKAIELSHCEHYRDYIHVSECAEGIIKICNINQSAIINLGSGNVIKLKDFILRFWEQLGSNSNMLHFGSFDKPDYEPTQPYCYADLKLLKELTSWAPSKSIGEGIKETVYDLNKYKQKYME